MHRSSPRPPPAPPLLPHLKHSGDHLAEATVEDGIGDDCRDGGVLAPASGDEHQHHCTSSTGQQQQIRHTRAPTQSARQRTGVDVMPKDSTWAKTGRGGPHTPEHRTATCPSSAAAFEPTSGPDAAEPRAARLTCGHSEAEQSQGRWVADAGAADRRRHLMVGLLDAPSLCKRQALVGNRNKVCLGHILWLFWCHERVDFGTIEE